MILPAAFVGAYQDLIPALELVREYAEERFAAELRGVARHRLRRESSLPRAPSQNFKEVNWDRSARWMTWLE